MNSEIKPFITAINLNTKKIFQSFIHLPKPHHQ